VCPRHFGLSEWNHQSEYEIKPNRRFLIAHGQTATQIDYA
jgi:hypothetical protein